LAGGLRTSKDPIRRKEGAIRETMAPGSGPFSLRTGRVGRRERVREREVGREEEGKAEEFSAARTAERTGKPAVGGDDDQVQKGKGEAER